MQSKDYDLVSILRNIIFNLLKWLCTFFLGGTCSRNHVGRLPILKKFVKNNNYCCYYY